MDYHNFEEHVHAIVLERGQAYFDEGAVIDLEHTDTGWSAIVKGGEEYQVLLNGNEGLDDWVCNCPHDHGPVCKHVAATLYAIKQKIGGEFENKVKGLSESQAHQLIRSELLRSRAFRQVFRKFD